MRLLATPDTVATALLVRLGRIARRIDPPPDLSYEMARAALQTRALDAELAELVQDTAVDDLLVGVRGGDDVRLLSYESSRLTVELQVTVAGRRRGLVGQLVGGCACQVSVEAGGSVTVVPVDDAGCFVADGLPAGPLRVRVGAPAPAMTSWVTV